ncbi:MAG: Histidine kinase [Bacteroidota bacterium]
MYWLFQILGWTLWSLNETLVYTQNFGWRIEWLFSGIFNIILGIFLTHSYRIIYNKQSWQEFPLKKLIPYEILSLVLLSFIFTMINLPIDALILEENYSINISTFTFLQVILDFSKPIAIWQLIYFIYQYSNKKAEMQMKNQNLEMTIRATEGKMLRTQMNPHFVFNALNGIRSLIHESPEKAESAITKLSKLLRNSLLADRQNLIPIKEEIETVKDYLALEKIRYEERLEWEFDISDETKNGLIPPMILQTLVENSIKHGISKTIKGGKITISIQKIDEFILIKVINPGKLVGLENPESGFGTDITKQRLELIFGSTAQLNLEPFNKNNVLATVKFKYIS